MIAEFCLLDEDGNRTYSRVYRAVRKREDILRLTRLVSEGVVKYTWPDGYSTSIAVRHVPRREEDSECGVWSYDWMVDSAIEHGHPINKYKDTVIPASAAESICASVVEPSDDINPF